MARLSKKNILLVEDEPDSRDFLAMCLEKAGFRVRTAIDGVDALDKIKEKTPDLIILDAAMPRRSGMNLMRKLSQNDDWTKVPVILIVNDKQNDLGVKDGARIGGLCFKPPSYKCVLEKPVLPTKLAETAEKMIRVSRRAFG